MNIGKKTGKYEEKPTPLQKALSVIGAILCVIFGFMLICPVGVGADFFLCCCEGYDLL